MKKETGQSDYVWSLGLVFLVDVFVLSKFIDFFFC